MRSIRTIVWVLSSLFCFIPALATAESYGEAFRANAYTSGTQSLASIATGANGDSVLLWEDAERGGGRFVQRYDAAGRALQAEEWFLGFGASDVAVSASGNFAVLSVAPDGEGSGVFVKVLDRSGGVIVPEFRVNNTTSGDQLAGAIAMNASGQFAVIWKDIPTNGIYVKRYQANGIAVAPQALASVLSTSSYSLDIAIDAAGNFVATWDQFVGSNIDSYARRYAASGVAFAAPFRVNSFTPGHQAIPRIAMNGTGSFVVVWSSYSQSGGSNWGVYGQRYSAAGIPLSGEFQISAQTSAYDQGPNVAMAADGSFVTVWCDENPPIPAKVWARSYSGNGAPLGAPFAVSTDSTPKWFPQLGMDPDGNSMIGWRQFNVSTGENDVYARRYLPVGVVTEPLINGQIVTGLSGSAGSWRYFKISVPTGQATVDVSIWGNVGDADLYVRYGVVPTLSRWDGRPYLDGSNEAMRMLSFPPGDWYIGINGYSSYSSLGLQASSY